MATILLALAAEVAVVGLLSVVVYRHLNRRMEEKAGEDPLANTAYVKRALAFLMAWDAPPAAECCVTPEAIRLTSPLPPTDPAALRALGAEVTEGGGSYVAAMALFCPSATRRERYARAIEAAYFRRTGQRVRIHCFLQR